MDTNIVNVPKVSHLSRAIRTFGITFALWVIFLLLDIYHLYTPVSDNQGFIAQMLFGVPAVLLLNWKYGFKIWGIQLLVFFISIPVVWLLCMALIIGVGGVSFIP